MTVFPGRIELQTNGRADMLDITGPVAEIIGESGMRNGIATIFCPSATSAVSTIEYESGCLQDLERLFDEVAQENRSYAHNARWGDGNGHSHVRAALLKPSLTVPFIDGRPTLGTWQQIVFVDFDNRPRSRSLVVQLLGE